MKLFFIFFLSVILPVTLFSSEEEIWLAKGEQSFIRQDYAEAVFSYSKAIEINSKNIQALYSRGLAYLFWQKFEQALSDFDSVLELDSNHINALNNRGYLFLLGGLFDEALMDLDKAIELDENFAEAYINRGSTYSELNNFEGAVADFKKAIELNPDSYSPYVELGRVYYKTNDFETSIKNYSKAIEMGIKNPKVFYNRGNAYFKMNNFKKAIEDYSTCITLDPEDTEALNNRAVSYDKIGKAELAEEDRKKIRSISGLDEIFKPHDELVYIEKTDSSKTFKFIMPSHWNIAEYSSEFSNEVVISPETIDGINSPFNAGIRMSYNKNMWENYRVSSPDSLLEFWHGSIIQNSQSYHEYQIKSKKMISRSFKKGQINTSIVQFSKDSFPVQFIEYAQVKQNVLFYAFLQAPLVQIDYFQDIFDKIVESFDFVNYE